MCVRADWLQTLQTIFHTAQPSLQFALSKCVTDIRQSKTLSSLKRKLLQHQSLLVPKSKCVLHCHESVWLYYLYHLQQTCRRLSHKEIIGPLLNQIDFQKTQSSWKDQLGLCWLRSWLGAWLGDAEWWQMSSVSRCSQAKWNRLRQLFWETKLVLLQ